MAYSIHLENFEGPLDLLLYFIQRDKIDIYDIPIAHITREYLDYLGMIEALNVAVAGEFVLLAATLMRVKARMLLPRREEAGEEIVEDPRQELVEQLVAYQQFKYAALDLHELADVRSAYYPVGGMEATSTNGSQPSEYLSEVSLFDLMTVFREVFSRMPDREPLQIHPDPVKLDDQIRRIRQILSGHPEVNFRDLLESAGDLQTVVVTFLALLELLRQQAIELLQDKPFGGIIIKLRGAVA